MTRSLGMSANATAVITVRVRVVAVERRVTLWETQVVLVTKEMSPVKGGCMRPLTNVASPESRRLEGEHCALARLW
jgi:hypothetical protein